MTRQFCKPHCLPQINTVLECQSSDTKICCIELNLELTGCDADYGDDLTYDGLHTYQAGDVDCNPTAFTAVGYNRSGSAMWSTQGGENVPYRCLGDFWVLATPNYIIAVEWFSRCDSNIVDMVVWTQMEYRFGGVSWLQGPRYLVGYLETTADWYLSVPLTIPCAVKYTNWPPNNVSVPMSQFYEYNEIIDCGRVTSLSVNLNCPAAPCDGYPCYPSCVINMCDGNVNASLLFWNLDCDGSTGDHDGQFTWGGTGGGSGSDQFQAADWPSSVGLGTPTIECVSGNLVLDNVPIFGGTYGPFTMSPDCTDGEYSWTYTFTDPAGGGSGGGPGEFCILTIYTNNSGALP
jgi:hypothetical protein